MRNINENARSASDVDIIQKRAVDSRFCSTERTVITISNACTHQSISAIFHNGTHIIEIHMDIPMTQHNITNTLYCIAENFVNGAKSLFHRRGLINHFKHFLIIDNDDCIHRFTESRNTTLRIATAYRAFPFERHGHYSNSQDAQFACDLSNNWSGTGSCTTTHPGGDKYQISPLQFFGNKIAIFENRFTANVRFCACAKGFGDLLTDRHLIVCKAVFQSQGIRIDGEEFNTGNAHLDHAIDRIATGTTDTDYLYFCTAERDLAGNDTRKGFPFYVFIYVVHLVLPVID